MALNNAINTAALGAGFVYSDGLGGLSIGTPGGGGSIKVTKFTSSGTWTKDADCRYVTVLAWNGGSGGGSGRQGATTAAGGGGGGCTGGSLVWSSSEIFLDATETVTIGAGGAGGLTQASATTNGNDGSIGGVSSLGNVYASLGGGASGPNGRAGTTTTSGFANMPGDWIPISGFAGFPGIVYTNSRGSNVAPVNTDNVAYIPGYTGFNIVYANGTGGGGSGADSGTARQAGNGGGIQALGQSTTDMLNAGGIGGIASGTINGGAGNNAISTTGGRYVGATGGGGGGGQSGGASAGIGGAGGIPGGGGGGGGGSLNGTTSGAGGAGGRGELWVIEYLS